MKYFDVAVCGGGIAGVAAALAASRRGKKVILVEKQCILGGLATAGLIYIYLPVSDNRDVKIAGGLSAEWRYCGYRIYVPQSYGKNNHPEIPAE